jgi:hypothetical protein
MGSIIELNDTLQLTKEQGFPEVLNFEVHKDQPFTAEVFKDQIFEFHDKPQIRVYHTPPVRVFLVENTSGKWLYWGLIHILKISHDYVRKTTSGKYKIIYLYTPDEMQKAHELIDRNRNTIFFT